MTFLPAGMNSLQEATKCMNIKSISSRSSRGVSCTFNTAGSQKADADIPGDKRPTPELLLMVFLVHYSIRLKI